MFLWSFMWRALLISIYVRTERHKNFASLWLETRVAVGSIYTGIYSKPTNTKLLLLHSKYIPCSFTSDTIRVSLDQNAFLVVHLPREVWYETRNQNGLHLLTVLCILLLSFHSWFKRIIPCLIDYFIESTIKLGWAFHITGIYLHHFWHVLLEISVLSLESISAHIPFYESVPGR